MEVFYTPEKKINLSIALGFFDGLHKGHKKVINTAVETARKLNTKSAVISFVDHPTCLLLNRTPEYILSIEDKISTLKKLGVDYLYLLDFNKSLSEMSKEEYFKFLIEFTNPKSITTGFNHFFGKNKEGDTQFLQSECEKNNIKYQKIAPVKINEEIVSSSAIRKALMNADFDTSKKMLDYDFYIKGNVKYGQQLGRKIGFKTANIEYPDKLIKIPYGIYCTKIEYNQKEYKGITNWGIKPTISGENAPIAETHILNFDKDIYEENIKVSFLKKIRNEKKFDTLDNLKTQISKDVELCEKYFNN